MKNIYKAKRKEKIYKIKSGKGNPRVIKNKKYFKLVESLKNFPEMLEKRSIVVDENLMVLGGNMRLRAAKEAGLKEVWIDVAEGWTDKQKKEFIIKDNVSSGEWDLDMLANEWELDDLNNWGVDLDPNLFQEEEAVEPEIEFSEYLEESHNYVVLLFNNDIDWLSAQTHFDLKSVHSKRANGKAWSKGIGRVIDGAKYLKELKEGI